ncbi:hypothetical protein FOMPIDRAFT_1021113 [Fomitopsis schrenkii]|uniref:Uncharacterized protein n=1 Tax=Fomitopsis schrenkii TaxID=2126942 RepID=S8ESU3_FOMSC|nr:hypothetical protein FOMPIDRAFT_1021113 [Fomitopsis schrenkii]
MDRLLPSSSHPFRSTFIVFGGHALHTPLASCKARRDESRYDIVAALVDLLARASDVSTLETGPSTKGGKVRLP